MSERILKALMQLFAIVAKYDGISNTGREIVLSFLKQQLSQELVEQYIKIFDEFLETHHQASKKKDGSQKRTSLNSVKILKICTQINAELTQKQKVVVLIRLLEFIHSSNEISEQELEFITTVAETFNISKEEFDSCRAFVECKKGDIVDSKDILIVDGNQKNTYQLAKHIYSDSIPSKIIVLSVSSVNMYAFRYDGNTELQLNGQVINNEKIYILTEGSSIRSSKVKPIYYSDIISAFLSDKGKSKISFVARNLEYKFKGGKIGLRDINISEESGKLIGIMGGSGAGKSTLLNVLNSNDIPTGGEVLINGINIHTEKNKIEGVIGHVSQDDLLIEELTVFQNLFYNGKLCFGNLGDEEISKMVLELLTNLGLYEARDLKVGSPLEKTISGGQRKRLNIALELIREPSVLFVDEPTSGLSSRDSENIMDLLKELALKGKLIFVVIHQPSSEIFKMFDKLMILDVGGYPIYYGNPVDAIIYFKTLVSHVNNNSSECIECGNVNPEQIFNIIESKVLDEYGNITPNRKISPSEWNEHYKKNIEGKTKQINNSNARPESTFKIPNKLKQFAVFITRDVLAKLTNKQYLLINLLESPVLALILAYLIKFYNTDESNTIGYKFSENGNMTAYMFMSVVVALFVGLTVSAEEIIRDRKILKRESFLNLSRISYLFSKVSIMFFLSAIQTLSYVLIGNWVLDIRDMTMDYWMILFSTSCFANMMGLNISASFNSAVTIYILIPFLIIPQLLLSGVIVPFEKLNPDIPFQSQTTVPMTGEVMASRWAFEALAVNQFKNNKYQKQFYKLDKYRSISEYKKAYLIPKLSGHLDNAENNYKNPAKLKEVENELNILYNEINKEIKWGIKNIKCPSLNKINIKFFNSDIASETRDYFKKINSAYIKISNDAMNKKDEIIKMRSSTPEEKEKFIKEQMQYENVSIADLVTNRNDFTKIILKDGNYIQRMDPIFLDPIYSDIGRAHFYAPRKKIFGTYYDTYWVNIWVIWSMAIVAAFALYFDLLKKSIDFLERIGSLFGRKKSS